jgi:hypothetical protein
MYIVAKKRQNNGNPEEVEPEGRTEETVQEMAHKKNGAHGKTLKNMAHTTEDHKHNTFCT